MYGHFAVHGVNGYTELGRGIMNGRSGSGIRLVRLHVVLKRHTVLAGSQNKAVWSVVDLGRVTAFNVQYTTVAVQALQTRQ